MDNIAFPYDINSHGSGSMPVPLAILPEDLPVHALIVRVDRGFNRIVEGGGITRDTRWHGHTIATLLGPDSEISVGFHPQTPPPHDLNMRQNIKSAWAIDRGKVCDEPGRYHDSCSIFSITPEQHQRAICKIYEMRENPPLYQAVARKGHNCMTFILEIMKSAGIDLPPMWKKMVYPIAIDLLISIAAMEHTIFQRHLTPRDDVQHMSGQQTRQIFSRITSPLITPHM